MNYMNNLLETNLADNDALVPVKMGQTYEVSFRAKWLHGSPRLRFELYYNRLAKTVILEQPLVNATPGSAYFEPAELAAMLETKLGLPVILGSHDYH